MTHGHFIIRQTLEGKKRRLHLHAHHDGGTSSLVEDIYLLADTIVRRSFAPMHWLYQGCPTKEEVRARLDCDEWKRRRDAPAPYYAGTFLILPRAGQVERLLKPNVLEQECDAFCFFNYPDIYGIAAAITGLHWNRWQVKHLADVPHPGPALTLDVLEDTMPAPGMRFDTKLQVSLAKDSVHEFEDEDGKTGITEARAHIFKFMEGKHDQLIDMGRGLPAVDFWKQWKAAFRRELEAVAPLLTNYFDDADPLI